MTRALFALLVVASIAMPAFPKALCPPGRFTIDTAEPSALDGAELVLGRGHALVTDTCGAVRAGRFHAASGNWLYAVRARWPRCGGRRVALKARWDFDASYCTRLSGTLRTGAGRRTAFVADRVPECGNELREAGELCDGSAGTFFDSSCCTATCTLGPGCPRFCDDSFPCDGDDVCGGVCGFGGLCVTRASVVCDGQPVCGCDTVTTYADRCAAYAAGTGVWRQGACPTP